MKQVTETSFTFPVEFLVIKYCGTVAFIIIVVAATMWWGLHNNLLSHLPQNEINQENYVEINESNT